MADVKFGTFHNFWKMTKGLVVILRNNNGEKWEVRLTIIALGAITKLKTRFCRFKLLLKIAF